MSRILGLTVLAFLLGGTAQPADSPKKTPRQALQAFNDLIGSWRASGTPQKGTRAEQNRNSWAEKLVWEWQFKNDDAWLIVTFDKGKYFQTGELRYLPDADRFRLTLQTVGKETIHFEGQRADRLLMLERTDQTRKEVQRLVFSFLHPNRFLYHYETRPADRTFWVRHYLVGATKDGEPFAVAPGQTGPECIVSGGPGTIAVKYKGETYYVCCGGCRSAFLDEPEKFIREAAAKKARGK